MSPSKPGPPTGPLVGTTVLELGSFVAGPFAGQLLADLGADVIKIERPGAGDVMRRWGVMWRGRSVWWSALSRNKRSVAIDLRDPTARALVRQMADRCDIVLENFTPGRLEEWGMGYDDLAASNPRLVMTRVSGFGQTGPRSREPGFGSIGEAMGGLRELTGDPDRPPARASVSMGDQISGMMAVIGTLAALQESRRTGRGQVVDVALYESVFALTESMVADYELTGTVRTRAGGTLPGVAPSNAYPTADGRNVMIAANADPIFARLADAMGRPDLFDDDRYRTHQARGARTEEVDELVSTWTRRHQFEELNTILEEHAIPHGLIYTASDVAEDPQYKAREMLQRVADIELGVDVPMTAIVPKLSRTPGTIRWSGPPVGYHTAEVLAELCLCAPSQIRDLEARGVIETYSPPDASCIL